MDENMADFVITNDMLSAFTTTTRVQITVDINTKKSIKIPKESFGYATTQIMIQEEIKDWEIYLKKDNSGLSPLAVVNHGCLKFVGQLKVKLQNLGRFDVTLPAHTTLGTLEISPFLNTDWTK